MRLAPGRALRPRLRPVPEQEGSKTYCLLFNILYNGSKRYTIGGPAGEPVVIMWWKILLFVGMTAMIVGSYVLPAPQQTIGDASRVFYYHIPQAWICVLAFTMSMIFSLRYLGKKAIVEDDRAVAAAGLGFVFCLMATVSGSIFARVTWGSFWNWDPRETSIFILLLIYGAYFALRGAIDVEERRAALSAVYAIFAFVTVPFLIFVVPRIVPSLHPEDSVVSSELRFTMGPAVRIVFFSSLALFTVLFFWMFSLARRVTVLIRAGLEEA
ncbi:MAG TPA: cytochrome c biogenesis protein [Acidobacteriota bacterium]|nr:cytochrome c biogenesis protein [Acidobacteriota bacterium]